MFKGLAIILIFSSCTLVGMFSSSQLQRRKKLLLDFQDFLQKLETEMGYFKEPLPEMFQKFHQNSNLPLDILLRQCLWTLERTDSSVQEAWRAAIYSAYENEPLKPADLAVLCKCGDFLGQSDYLGQKGYFALLKQELSRQIQEATDFCKTKGTLYNKAGISIGAVLAIALL